MNDVIRTSKPLAQRLKERAAIRRMEDRLDDAELFDEAALALATTPETLQPASNERLSDTNLRNIRTWAENHLEFSSDDSGPRMIAEAMDELLMRRRAAETCERRNQDERTLRRLLAFAYSGSALYGDDGELQDGRHPMIDYVRDSVADIERKIHERGMAKLAAAACPECRYVIGHKAGCSSEKANSCVCGEPNSPGTHRTDGPCLAPIGDHHP